VAGQLGEVYLKITPQGVEQVIGGFDKIQSAGNRAGKGLAGVFSGASQGAETLIKKLAAMAAGYVSLQAVTRSFLGGAREFMEDEKALNRASLAAGRYTDNLTALRERLQTVGDEYAVIGVSSGTTYAAFQRLIGATGEQERAFKLLSVAQGFSRATGESLELVANALTLAYAGKTRQLIQLAAQYGIATESGEGFSSIVSKLTDYIGKGGGAMTDYEKSLKRLGHTWQETWKSIFVVVEPIVTKLLQVTDQLLGNYTVMLGLKGKPGSYERMVADLEVGMNSAISQGMVKAPAGGVHAEAQRQVYQQMVAKWTAHYLVGKRGKEITETFPGGFDAEGFWIPGGVRGTGRYEMKGGEFAGLPANARDAAIMYLASIGIYDPDQLGPTGGGTPLPIGGDEEDDTGTPEAVEKEKERRAYGYAKRARNRVMRRKLGRERVGTGGEIGIDYGGAAFQAQAEQIEAINQRIAESYQRLGNFITQSFQPVIASLSQSFTDLLFTGKASFADLGKVIVESVKRIVQQLITATLTALAFQAVMAVISGGTSIPFAAAFGSAMGLGGLSLSKDTATGDQWVRTQSRDIARQMRLGMEGQLAYATTGGVRVVVHEATPATWVEVLGGLPVAATQQIQRRDGNWRRGYAREESR
jgi:hypothetical protein